MKKSTFHPFGVIILFLISSCSKNLEKNLNKKDGIWNYTFDYLQVADNEYILKEYSGTGKFNFNKDGTFRQTEDNNTEFGSWISKNDSIILKYSNYERIYKVSDIKNKEQRWEHTNVTSSTIGTTTTKIKLHLKRGK